MKDFAERIDHSNPTPVENAQPRWRVHTLRTGGHTLLRDFAERRLLPPWPPMEVSNQKCS